MISTIRRHFWHGGSASHGRAFRTVAHYRQVVAVMAGMQRDSYYRQNRHSPALIRARRPYIVKNAILGTGICVFALGIYAYTISAVGQDEFEDVKVPEAPIRNPQGFDQGLKK